MTASFPHRSTCPDRRHFIVTGAAGVAAAAVGSTWSGSPAGAAPTTFTDDVMFQSGTPWVDLRSYGAPNDGTGDCKTAFTNALAALTSGGVTSGTLFISEGTYRFATTVTLPTNMKGLIVRGAGAGANNQGGPNYQGTKLVTAAAVTLFQQTESSSAQVVCFEDFAYGGEYQGIAGGHIFDWAGGASDLVFQRISAALPWNKSFFRKTGPSDVNAAGVYDSVIRDCWIAQTNGTVTVPAIDVNTPGSAFSNNTLENLRITSSANAVAPCISLNVSSPSTYLYGNTLRNINFEQPTGGMIRLLGCYGTVIQSCRAWDLDAAYQAGAHLIAIGRGYPAGSPSQRTTILNSGRVAGVFKAATPPWQDVWLQNSYAQWTTIIDLNAPDSPPPRLDAGGHFVVALNLPKSTVVTLGQNVTVVDGDGVRIGDGIQVRSGNGAPAAGTGVVGDAYFNRSGGSSSNTWLYRRTAAGWTGVL